MSHQSLALVGAAGGVGTTRLTLELAAVLARDGRDVAVFDAAYATQGLADYLPGTVGTDATALTLGDDPLDAGLGDHPAGEDLPGRLALCPARAPFERIARAKAPEAAQRLEDLIRVGAGSFDHVLVDTPPVAANQAVAAATCADRVALVTAGTARGVDALPRMADRLVDVGAPADLELATRVDGANPVERADAAVPAERIDDARDAPVAARGTGEFTAAVAAAAGAALGTELGVELGDSGRLGGLLPGDR